MTELKPTTVFDAYWKASSVGEGTGAQVYWKSEADTYIADIVVEHEAELDKWYAKLCHNRWRRAYAMFKHCCDMNIIEGYAPAHTMNPHQWWRHDTAYWARWTKRWLRVYLEYKERIE